MNDTATLLTGGKHGTKWIGGILIALGAASSIDPSTVPPSWLPWIAMASGAAAMARGVVNTKNQQQP